MSIHNAGRVWQPLSQDTEGGSSQNVYSTEETVVGILYANNGETRSVYRQLISTETPSETGTFSVVHAPIENLYLILSLSAIMKEVGTSRGLRFKSLPGKDGHGDDMDIEYRSDYGFRVKVTNDDAMSKPLYITVEYIKSVDDETT